MKTLKMIVGALVLASSSLASAGEPILTNLAGPGWEEFESDLRKENHLQGDAFPTEILAVLAAKIAQGKKLPVGELPWPEFRAAFLKENNLGKMIKVSDFRGLGQTKQILMPDLPKAAATPAATTPVTSTGIIAPPVAAVATTPVEQPKADPLAAFAIAAQFTSLEKEVTALKLEAAKATSSEGNVKAVAAQVGELQAKLAALTTAQASFAKKGEEGAALKSTFETQSKRIEDALAGITASNNAAVAALKGDVDSLKKQVGTLTADVAEVKASALPQWLYYLVGAVGILSLLVLALFGLNRTRKGEVAVVAAAASALAKRVKETEDDQSVASGQVSDLATELKEVKKFVGFRRVIFPEDFDEQLNFLGPQHKNYSFLVATADAPDEFVSLRVVYDSAGYVKIFGVADQTRPVKLRAANVRSIIGRAAQLDVHGQSRLVGEIPAKAQTLTAVA